jgi:phosphatidylglycerol:prolipoprotein diacylglycerol transferase
MSYNGADLIFPHLGIVIQNMHNHITLPGGFTIAFYGIIIGIGMLLALLVIERDAVRHGCDPGIYYDYFLIAITTGVIGARIYYVIFQWEYYRGDILKIINIRQGGLAIYGGILAALLAAVIFCRVRNYPFFKLSDSAVLGVLTGQILGRWGNFFNCEAFGGYTDSLFAMRIKEAIVNPSMISDAVREHIILDNGIRYIQVHPTFLYESCWNLAALISLYNYGRKKELGSGNVTIGYFLLYGIGRFLIEGLRTDQLKIPGTVIPVSQALSACIVILMAGLIIYRCVKKNRLKNA